MSVIERLQQKVPCLMSRRTSFILMTFLLGVFFLIEVVVGYITNSMALIADSFHMLSDVASLIVGYLALKYSSRDSPRDTYTYGYARAEVLGALVNAVFLVALCFSIFIEAMKRLVILEGIENPDLVFFVGLAGLIVNIFGMFLFHQTGHGHSHGGMSHSHSHGGSGGHEHSHGGGDGHAHHDDSHSHGSSSGHSHGDKPHGHSHSHGGSKGHDHSHGDKPHGHSHSHGGSNGHGHSHGDKHDIDGEHKEDQCADDERNPFLQKSADERKLAGDHSPERLPYPEKHGANPFLNSTPEEKNVATLDEISDIEQEKSFYDNDEKSNLLEEDPPKSKNTAVQPCDGRSSRKPEPTKSAGHLNIEGVYLHILGDALGSIIVMISALFLIYGHGPWTLYVDPTMSIIMVIIILKTSIPLLMETAKILMNSAPQHIHMSDLRRRLVSTIPEIKNIHDLHVWQLAGDKIIASVHVKFESPDDYDESAAKIKDFFHDEGIHSTTVQIEFERNDNVDRRGHCTVVCSLDSACDEMLCCKPEKE